MTYRKFSWKDPETGEVIRAEWTTMLQHHERARRKLPDGQFASHFVYVLEITHWGFDREKSIVVCLEQETGKFWAFKLEQLFDAETKVPGLI